LGKNLWKKLSLKEEREKERGGRKLQEEKSKKKVLPKRKVHSPKIGGKKGGGTIDGGC